jgi:hypothetical protein
MPPKVKSASKQITVTFSPEKNYVFAIDGRGTSVLGKLQGDHVTAYGLVETGFYRALSGMDMSEINELFELQNRDSLRGRRGKVYDFISALASLDEERAETLYLEIDKILKDYNDKRHSKTELRADTKSAQEDDSLEGRNLERVLRSIELEYKENGDFVRESLLKMVSLTMTFYNHIPGTAYFPIPEFEAGKDEGSAVKTAISSIETAISDAKPYSKQTTIAARTQVKNIMKSAVEAISSLMHYPEIIDVAYDEGKPTEKVKIAESFLGEHRAKTLADGAKTAKARDNSEANLVAALTRHLHITLAVYPELGEVFDKKELTKTFVKRMIGGKGGVATDMGWPTFNADVKISSIAASVETALTALETKTKDSHYTNYTDYDDLVSSDDEEEPTKLTPKKAPKPQVAKQLFKTEASLEEELDRLRKLEIAVKKLQSDGKLPAALKIELEKTDPSLFVGKPGATHSK